MAIPIVLLTPHVAAHAVINLKGDQKPWYIFSEMK